MMTHDEIKADILQYLSDEYWYCKDKNGRFNVELYADYRIFQRVIISACRLRLTIS